MAHGPSDGHHKTSEPIGIKDTVIGAVLFIALVFGMRALLDVAVPGLLKPETMVHIIISGLMFVGAWALLGNYLFQPYLNLFEEREARTKGDEVRALEKRREAAELQSKIDEELRLARLEGIKVRDAKVEEAKRAAGDVLAAAQSASESDLGRAQQKLEQLRGEARGEVAQESEKLASLLVTKALSSGPNQTIH